MNTKKILYYTRVAALVIIYFIVMYALGSSLIQQKPISQIIDWEWWTLFFGVSVFFNLEVKSIKDDSN